ncbi:MAG: hypothetical protein ACI4QM_04735 [Alphaproteobacteria bacterium]
MHTDKTVFTKKKESLIRKIKRFSFSIAVYLPVLGILYGTGVYLKGHMNDYTNTYFNVSVAKKTATLTQKRLDNVKQYMSSPIDWPIYLSAGIDNIRAATKASTLETTAHMATGLLNGLVNLIVLLGSIYIAFKILQHYKTRTAEDRLTRKIINELLPVLNEINENIKKQTNQRSPLP